MGSFLEYVMKYKILLFFLFVLLVGGAAFFLGRSSGGDPAPAAAPKTVSTEKVVEPKSESNLGAKEKAEKNIEDAEKRAQRIIKENNERIEENNRKIDENPKYGTVKNGTRQIAPPKFPTSDVPTRKADFQD